MEPLLHFKVSVSKLGAQLQKTRRQLDASDRMMIQAMALFVKTADSLNQIKQDLTNLQRTRLQLQREVEVLLDQMKLQETLADDFEYDDENEVQEGNDTSMLSDRNETTDGDGKNEQSENTEMENNEVQEGNDTSMLSDRNETTDVDGKNEQSENTEMENTQL